MRVIEAEIGHLDDIARIHSQIKVYIPGFKWDMKEWVKDEIDNHNFYVCEDDGGKVVGAMCLQFRNGDAEIETLVVSKDMHRRGIGTLLVNTAKSASRFCSKTRLIARSFYDYNAKDFYLKQGFSLKEEPFVFLGKEAHDFYMDLI